MPEVGGRELELARSRDDRRRYEIDGVGSLRLNGWFGRGATADAGGTSWSFDHYGFWRRAILASDAAGAPVGSFEPRSLRRGGALRWRGRDLELRPASRWKQRYAVVDGDRELAVLEGKGWGRRPVRMTVDDDIEPGLLLFAAFVVRGLADDASSSAAGSTAATTG
jgi:hypothetical protein